MRAWLEAVRSLNMNQTGSQDWSVEMDHFSLTRVTHSSSDVTIGFGLHDMKTNQ